MTKNNIKYLITFKSLLEKNAQTVVWFGAILDKFAEAVNSLGVETSISTGTEIVGDKRRAKLTFEFKPKNRKYPLLTNVTFRGSTFNISSNKEMTLINEASSQAKVLKSAIEFINLIKSSYLECAEEHEESNDTAPPVPTESTESTESTVPTEPKDSNDTSPTVPPEPEKKPKNQSNKSKKTNKSKKNKESKESKKTKEPKKNKESKKTKE